MPGGVDPHTHMQLPTMGTVVADDFLSGTAAAAAGGTTTLLDFAGPDRGESPIAALDRWQGWAARSTVDYGLHMTVSWWGDAVRRRDGAAGPAIGASPASSSSPPTRAACMLSDEDLIKGFLRCRSSARCRRSTPRTATSSPTCSRSWSAEGVTGPRGHVLPAPPACEAEATFRCITMAEVLDVPLYVVHVSAGGAAEAIAAARAARGVKVVGETLPNFLCHRRLGLRAARVRLRGRPRHEPALPAQGAPGGALAGAGRGRPHHHRHRPLLLHHRAEAGRRATTSGASPTAAAAWRSGSTSLWHLGVNGGRLTPERFVALTSTNAARAFNLWPRKGSLEVGRRRRRDRPRPGPDPDASRPGPSGSGPTSRSGRGWRPGGRWSRRWPAAGTSGGRRRPARRGGPRPLPAADALRTGLPGR